MAAAWPEAEVDLANSDVLHPVPTADGGDAPLGREQRRVLLLGEHPKDQSDGGNKLNLIRTIVLSTLVSHRHAKRRRER